MLAKDAKDDPVARHRGHAIRRPSVVLMGRILEQWDGLDISTRTNDYFHADSRTPETGFSQE